MNHLRSQKRRGAVHVVDVTAVDPNRRQQSRIFGDWRQIVAHLAAFNKNGASRVAALDGTVGVVPLIDPADRHDGMLLVSGFAEGRPLAEIAKHCKCPIQHAAIAASSHQQLCLAIDPGFSNPESFRSQIGRDLHPRIGRLYFLRSANYRDAVTLGDG